MTQTATTTSQTRSLLGLKTHHNYTSIIHISQIYGCNFSWPHNWLHIATFMRPTARHEYGKTASMVYHIEVNISVITQCVTIIISHQKDFRYITLQMYRMGEKKGITRTRKKQRLLPRQLKHFKSGALLCCLAYVSNMVLLFCIYFFELAVCHYCTMPCLCQHAHVHAT